MANGNRPIILGAQACGFGPVSKLAALARLLPHEDIVFIGDGPALEFAERHRQWFGRIIPCLPDALPSVRSLLVDCDFAVVVMHHELAFWITKFGRPVYFFDSLFGFWVLHHPLSTLADASESIRRQAPQEAHRTFHSFPVHERKLIGHLLARFAYVQNGPRVEERLRGLRACGVQHIELIGSIVDVGGKVPDGSLVEWPASNGEGLEILVNLGGVRNFILEFYKNDYYIDLFERWGRDFLRTHPECRRLLLCCGRYSKPRSEAVGRGLLVREFLSHDRFVSAVQAADVYMTAPGLTAIHEAVQLGRIPVLVPEQHFSQFYNLVTLGDTGLGRLAVGLADLIDGYEVPDDDLRGSETIIAHAKSLYDDDARYQRFRSELDKRVELARTMSGHERAAILLELRGLFDGTTLGQVVQEMLADARPLQPA